MKGKRIFVLSLILLIGLGVFCLNIVSAQESAVPTSSVVKVAKSATPAKSASPVATSSKNVYMGAGKCSACHPTEFNDFEKRKFNKSWKILKMRGEEKNAECLKCHVTGFGKGGFESEEKTPHLVGKQCEACHGPGGKHISNPSDAGFRKDLRISEKKNVCIECHACMTTHKSSVF